MRKEMDLTVAICVYNGAKYIEETLDSLAGQTYKEFALLIVDDCSSDNTVERVKKYFEQGRFRGSRIILSKKNGGVALARKKALNETYSDFMLFFDADDIAEPDMIEKMRNRLLADENLIAIGGYESMIDDEGKKLVGGVRVGFTEKSEALEKAKHGKLFFLPMSSMFRMKEAKKVGGFILNGFPEGKPRYADFCEDCDLWTRMSDLYTEGKYLLVIPENLSKYRKHNISVSNDNYSMLLRMKHIKNNVKLRRKGLEDISFIEFEKQLYSKVKEDLKKEAEAGKHIRSAGFAAHEHKYLSAVYFSFFAVIKHPKYVFDKITPFIKRNN